MNLSIPALKAHLVAQGLPMSEGPHLNTQDMREYAHHMKLAHGVPLVMALYGLAYPMGFLLNFVEDAEEALGLEVSEAPPAAVVAEDQEEAPAADPVVPPAADPVVPPVAAPVVPPVVADEGEAASGEPPADKVEDKAEGEGESETEQDKE